MVDHYSDNLFPFRINRNSNKVFAKELDEMWEAFVIYLQEKFQPQIASIKQNLNTGERLTFEAPMPRDMAGLVNDLRRLSLVEERPGV